MPARQTPPPGTVPGQKQPLEDVASGCGGADQSAAVCAGCGTYGAVHNGIGSDHLRDELFGWKNLGGLDNYGPLVYG